MKSKASINRSKFGRLLTLILLLQIVGFFTISENILITRVLKILLRMGTLGWLILVYQSLGNKGLLKNFSYQNTLSPILYGAYLFMGVVSLLWSTDVGYSTLQLVMDLESLVFAYFLIKTIVRFNFYHAETPLSISHCLFYSIFWVLLIFVIGMYIDPDTFFRLTHGGEVARLGGILMNPNELGMLAVVGIGCALVYWNESRYKWRTLLFAAVILYALIMTGSRSSMIGLLLVVFLFVNKLGKSSLKFLVYAGMGLAIPVIIRFIFIKQGDLDEVLSMTGRLPFWKALLTEGLEKSPWYGFGFMRISWTGAFKSVHTYEGHMTHNTFIQVLMNLGFIGLAIVVFQMIFTLRAHLKSDDRIVRMTFIGIYIPILINSFTEFGIFGETNFGILFYQILIWMNTIKYSPVFTSSQKLQLTISGRFPEIARVSN